MFQTFSFHQYKFYNRGMIWMHLSFILFILLCFFLSSVKPKLASTRLREPYKRDDLLALREEVRECFFHVYNAYMRNAYPHDELKPLSCTGRPAVSTRGDLDDILGNFSLTLGTK